MVMNHLNNIIFILFIILIQLIVCAYTQNNFTVLLSGERYNGVKVQDIKLDNNNNTYIVGTIESNKLVNTTLAFTTGAKDIIIAKYSSSGVKEWAELLGGINHDYGGGITIDSSSNLFVTGYSTSGNIDSEMNSGNPGTADIVIAKYSSSGVREWVKLLGGISHDYGLGITSDSSSNIYITGYTTGNIDSEISNGDNDIVVAKYSSSGAKQWVTLLGGLYNDYGKAITIDASSNIYITGYTASNITGEINNGGIDIVIAKYSSSGVKEWVKLLGGTSNDYGYGITIDLSSNIYITGRALGNIEGQINNGNDDIVIAKYSSSGVKEWLKLLGGSGDDYGEAITIDSSSTNIYLSGHTDGNIDGETNSGGSYDFVIAKYSVSGVKHWVKLFDVGVDTVSSQIDNANSIAIDSSNTIHVGLPQSSKLILKYSANSITSYINNADIPFNAYNEGNALVLDSSSNIYITGTTSGIYGKVSDGTNDIVIAKYSSSGVKRWIELFGGSGDDRGTGITVDSSSTNIYISGYTSANIDSEVNNGGTDIVIAKYASSGIKQWVKLLGGSSDDYGTAITIDSSSNIYITGYTFGGIDSETSNGGFDIMIAKYSSSGIKQWLKLLGGGGSEVAYGIAMDSSSTNIYIIGYGGSNFDGQLNNGSTDIIIAKYSLSGVKEWIKLLGGTAQDYGRAITVDSSSNIYIIGYTQGNIDNEINNGIASNDIVIAKYSSSGIKQWVTFLGGSDSDFGYGIAIDSSSSNIYITGTTYGTIDGKVSNGNIDIVIAKYSSSGIKQWVKLLGSNDYDYGHGIAVSQTSEILFTGYEYILPSKYSIRITNLGVEIIESCPIGLVLSNNKCHLCSAGYYTNTSGGISNCLLCPAGYFSNQEGVTSCQSCNVGTYASEDGSIGCDSCDLDIYTTGDKNTYCSAKYCYCADSLITYCVIIILISFVLISYSLSKATRFIWTTTLFSVADLFTDLSYVLIQPFRSRILQVLFTIVLLIQFPYFVYSIPPKLSSLMNIPLKLFRFERISEVRGEFLMDLLNVIIHILKSILAIIFFIMMIVIGYVLFVLKILAVPTFGVIYMKWWNSELIDLNQLKTSQGVIPRLYHSAMLGELLLEALPQIILQIINNEGQWNSIALISFMFSCVSIFNHFYRYIYWYFYIGKPLEEIPMGFGGGKFLSSCYMNKNNNNKNNNNKNNNNNISNPASKSTTQMVNINSSSSRIEKRKKIEELERQAEALKEELENGDSSDDDSKTNSIQTQSNVSGISSMNSAMNVTKVLSASSNKSVNRQSIIILDHDDMKEIDSNKVIWTRHETDDGIEYYHNHVTGESVWEKPDDFVE